MNMIGQPHDEHHRAHQLDEQDFYELQQLDYPLDQLLAYAPASAEDLGLSVAVLTERQPEPCAVAEPQMRIEHPYTVQHIPAYQQPMVTRYASIESSEPSSPRGSDTISEGSERCLSSKQRKTAWTNVEDRIIEEGVATFGHKWSKIAEMLPHERTDDAVRNRWQRLRRRQQRRMQMLQRQSSESSERGVPLADLTLANSPRPNAAADGKPAMLVQCCVSGAASPSGPLAEEGGKHGDMWTPEEDHIIDIAVRIQGLRWRAIAAMLPGRTDSGCRNRWVRSQERRLAALGTPVHGAAEVFAALRAAGQMPGLKSGTPIPAA